MDSRIGPKFLRAGLGYGGSCFPKDVAAFHWVAQQQGVDFQLLQEIRKINETQRDIFFNKVLSALWTLRGKRLAALGLALQRRHGRHSRVPGDRDRSRNCWKRALRSRPTIRRPWSAPKPCCRPRKSCAMPTDIYEAAKDADAVLILTDWKEFAALDLVRLNQAVRFPIVIDGRNLYKPQEMLEHGFTYVSVGRPASYQAQQGKPRR